MLNGFLAVYPCVSCQLGLCHIVICSFNPADSISLSSVKKSLFSCLCSCSLNALLEMVKFSPDRLEGGMRTMRPEKDNCALKSKQHRNGSQGGGGNRVIT